MGRALGLVAALLAAATTGVRGQQYDPRTDFCRRFSHEAAVLGDRLYIDGGQLNLAGKGGKNFTNDRLLWHDLTQTKLDGKDIEMPVLMTNLSKPDEVPSVIGGILWADQANGRLFQYGGEWPEPGVPDEQFDLWTYDTYNDSWAKREVARDIMRLSFGAGMAVEESGKGYYLGGWMSSRSDINWRAPKLASNRMVEYDFVADTWQNSTGPDDKAGRAEGAMFYIPAGDKGMLAHFGGVRIADKDGAEEEPASMAVIDLYDLASGRWYTQNATGDIPESRRRFCGGVAHAQDRSSSNIYIYGGLGFGANSTGYDDVHILTIPTFQWIKVFPGKGVVVQEKDKYPHYDLSCSVVKNSQLLIIGGQFPKDLDANNCDAQEKAGVHNLVMSKVNKGTESVYWEVFDPERSVYTVPDDILDVIGGDAQGHAAVKSPKNNFEFNDVEVLFRRTYAPAARTPTRTAPAAFATSTSASSAKSTDDSGAFATPAKQATILVPTIIGIALLAGLGFFLFRRRRQNAASRPAEEPPGYKPYNSAAAESVVTSSYTPTGTFNGYQPPYPPPPPLMGYDTTGNGYSDAGAQLSPPPPQELPQHGWRSPEPMSIRSPVPGHYPPPLLEGLTEARSPGPGQEMKERR